MTSDERAELLQDAGSLAYQHIRFSGLYRELSSEQWEGMAREHAEQVVRLLERLVDARFTQIEAGRRACRGYARNQCERGAIR